jgi:hypothetical protein
MDDGATIITGGCLCRAVRFTITAPPIAARTCWCRLCQHIAAGSGTVNVIFPADAVSVQGDMTDYACAAESGSHMHRHFCPVCGSSLFSAAEERPHLVIVRAGALDDPEIGRPAMTIWASQAPRWACIDADLPRTPKQPA